MPVCGVRYPVSVLEYFPTHKRAPMDFPGSVYVYSRGLLTVFLTCLSWAHLKVCHTLSKLNTLLPCGRLVVATEGLTRNVQQKQKSKLLFCTGITHMLNKGYAQFCEPYPRNIQGL